MERPPLGRARGNAEPHGPVFRGDRVGLGTFRARPIDPWFGDSGPARGFLVVFPRTLVRILQSGRRAVVADPTRAILYNLGQEYRREAVSPVGDRCEWFGFGAGDVVEAVRPFDPSVVDRPQAPFAFVDAPVDPRAYALQRLVFEEAARGKAVDAMRVEETGLLLLQRVVASAYGSRGGSPPASTSTRAARSHAALADAVIAFVASRFTERLTLERIASAVEASPFHVCRVFRRATGRTLHAYVDTLRLHRALEELGDRRGDLTGLALDVGYASHAHFTAAFRRRFGAPPSEIVRLGARPSAIDPRAWLEAR